MNNKFALVLFLIIAAMSSCFDKGSTNPKTPAQLEADSLQLTKKLVKKTKVTISDFIPLHGTEWIAYPIGDYDSSNNNRSYVYGGSYYKDKDWVYNIHFYNVANQEKHPLFNHNKYIINNLDNISDYYPQPGQQFSAHNQYVRSLQVEPNYIFYLVTTTDYNQDGLLNSMDPSYLFASDSIGQQVRQLSPDSLDVLSWTKPHPGLPIIELVLREDSNKNNTFEYDIDDKQILMLDLRKEGHFKKVFTKKEIQNIKEDLVRNNLELKRD